MRSLNAVATAQEITDGMPIHLVVSKLDQTMREKWEEALPTNKLPKWTDMSLFLEKRCMMRENLENAAVDPIPSSQKTRLGWIVAGNLSAGKSKLSILTASRMESAQHSESESLADIVKRFWECILWRENPEDEVKVYTLDTVTYGTKSAAFLAIRSMQQLSQDEEANFPLAAKVVRRDFYVDDLISGGDTVEEVTKIRMQVKELLRRGHFLIRKWCSNEPAALEGESEDDRERLLKFHDETDIAKTLGLVWDPSSDDLIFHFSEELPERPTTKRAILSAIAKFYDPLGLIAPIITKLKIFLQELWKYKLDWDESLPLAQHSSWLEHKSRISAATSFKFPRFVLLPHASWEIHGFCDASMSAYGACIYIRSESKGELTSRLLCSKSRVAPLKTFTIPKLELAAAHLLSELISNIAEIVQLSCSFYCWSDSTIVLSWIREAPSNFNVFVSNRIAQIQERTKGMTWRHVPSEMNPADVLSGAKDLSFCVQKHPTGQQLHRLLEIYLNAGGKH
ncbi:hypothetical protein ACLKA6_017606 [Drosophila palustris]